MVDTTHAGSPATRPDTDSAAPAPARISIFALGMSLSLSLAITYVLCVLFDLWLPDQAMYAAWAPFFPGFTWLSWPSFFLGLAESLAYGWYFALLAGTLYRVFAADLRPRFAAGRRRDIS